MQAEHALAPAAAEKEPTAHAVHAATAALFRLLYVPASQDVHADATLSVLYRPAPHDVHVALVVDRLLLLYAPAPHDTHAAAAMAPPALYEPVAHAAQPPEGAVPYPGVQLRAAMITSSTPSTRFPVVADA